MVRRAAVRTWIRHVGKGIQGRWQNLRSGSEQRDLSASVHDASYPVLLSLVSRCWAKERRTFRVSRPMELVVLNCCQENWPVGLGRKGGGSPAWIRTTIHGSKGRCPTIRRPGMLQERGIFSVSSLPAARNGFTPPCRRKMIMSYLRKVEMSG